MPKIERLIEANLLGKHKKFEERKWGTYRITMLRRVLNEGSGSFETHIQKVLTVYPKKRLSLQRHKLRREFWTIHAGRAKVTLGMKLTDLVVTKHKVGDEISIKLGMIHRLENPDRKNNLIIIENAYGQYNEEDIDRLEDDFGRAKK